MQITNSTSADLDFIFHLFDEAIAYQKRNGYDLWPQFSRELIAAEMEEKRHWKIVDGDSVICFFSVMYNDPIIWGERDIDPSVYLHRITINPAFKGKGIMTIIREWAVNHARQTNKKFVRMDTWGNNLPLREYYIKCGFPYIGQQYLKNVEGLPAHYGGSILSLFQLEI